MWLGSMLAGLWDQQQHAKTDPNIGRRLIAATAGGAVGGFIAIVFSSIWFPPDSWIEWIQAVRVMPDEIIQTHQGNFSPIYFVRSCGLPGWLVSLTGPVMAGTFILAVMRRTQNHFQETGLETRPAEIAVWLAIGCQIHLLTSNLVWYQYCVLSLPAMVVILREVVSAPSRSETLILSGILLWCLLLIGLQPVDELLASRSVEHMFRCTIANGILLLLIVMLPAKQRQDS